MSNFVSDLDIIKLTNIDFRELAKIVAETGASVDGLVGLVFKHEKHDKTCYEIGFIRYPDLDQPFVKVYRLRFTAWRTCTRYLAYQNDEGGLFAELDVLKYKARSTIVGELQREIKDKTLQALRDRYNLSLTDSKKE